jgi:hypothetical protein
MEVCSSIAEWPICPHVAKLDRCNFRRIDLSVLGGSEKNPILPAPDMHVENTNNTVSRASGLALATHGGIVDLGVLTRIYDIV